ncbi:2Fe-2S iron-sulfur cluster-binding protein [Rhodococcoides fascians]|uniref:2Fe-2S iron-sulfur cluster-binding protein n=1 Tax=Rhodococcoides fascians TaxID=1828 RepID=UPI002ACDFBD2|nr:2Fe-2S iron-sulfur cluster-binding protein [Rhodococcus fascians]WQH28804.1 2Fe-2S iron-sulfur cluster-binding protein [Rhodococcus fascians]
MIDNDLASGRNEHPAVVETPVVSVVLEREDTDRVSFPCNVGQDIPTAAMAAGCRPRVMCERGGCGACRAVLVKGRVEHRGAVSKSKLEPAEPGGPECILMCRAVPLEDLVLKPLHKWAVRPVSRLRAALPKNSASSHTHAPYDAHLPDAPKTTERN